MLIKINICINHQLNIVTYLCFINHPFNYLSPTPLTIYPINPQYLLIIYFVFSVITYIFLLMFIPFILIF